MPGRQLRGRGWREIIRSQSGQPRLTRLRSEKSSERRRLETAVAPRHLENESNHFVRPVVLAALESSRSRPSCRLISNWILVLGSAGVSPAGFCAPQKQSLSKRRGRKVRDGEGAITSERGARAPRTPRLGRRSLIEQDLTGANFFIRPSLRCASEWCARSGVRSRDRVSPKPAPCPQFGSTRA